MYDYMRVMYRGFSKYIKYAEFSEQILLRTFK
jgi:hypothetical protein